MNIAVPGFRRIDPTGSHLTNLLVAIQALVQAGSLSSVLKLSPFACDFLFVSDLPDINGEGYYKSIDYRNGANEAMVVIALPFPNTTHGSLVIFANEQATDEYVRDILQSLGAACAQPTA